MGQLLLIPALRINFMLSENTSDEPEVCDGVSSSQLSVSDEMSSAVGILSLNNQMLSKTFDNQAILITGGTGSFGQKFISTLFDNFKPQSVIVFSRDEFKQHHMRTVGGYSEEKYPNLHYVIGDIRNKQRLYETLRDYRVTMVVHTAAIKHIDICEKNPTECIDTNIIGSVNIVDACKEAGVRKVLALSTDKCVDPINIYGASKLCLERVMIAANNFREIAQNVDDKQRINEVTNVLNNNSNFNATPVQKDATLSFFSWAIKNKQKESNTIFSVARYGNVLGSRGSAIHVFTEQIKSGELKITDMNMTRFTIMKQEAVNFAMNCLSMMIGGEVFVPELPSYNIEQLINVMKPCDNFPVRVTGVRPGEKIHECMVSKHESHLAIRIIVHKSVQAHGDEPLVPIRMTTRPLPEKDCLHEKSKQDIGFYVIRHHYYGGYVDYQKYYAHMCGEEYVKACEKDWSYVSNGSYSLTNDKLKELIDIARSENV
jgi:UDP-N-acetylglucosamine 4,6-dehydratase